VIARILIHALLIGLALGILEHTISVPGVTLLLSPFHATGLITGSLSAAAGLHRHQGLAMGTLGLAVLLAWPLNNPAGLLGALLPVAAGLALGLAARALTPKEE
jgi:hypothetical protein